MKPGAEVQQEQASTGERVAEERRQHQAKQERCPSYEHGADPYRARTIPGPSGCRSHHRTCMLRSPAGTRRAMLPTNSCELPACEPIARGGRPRVLSLSACCHLLAAAEPVTHRLRCRTGILPLDRLRMIHSSAGRASMTRQSKPGRPVADYVGQGPAGQRAGVGA